MKTKKEILCEVLGCESSDISDDNIYDLLTEETEEGGLLDFIYEAMEAYSSEISKSFL